MHRRIAYILTLVTAVTTSIAFAATAPSSEQATECMRLAGVQRMSLPTPGGGIDVKGGDTPGVTVNAKNGSASIGLNKKGGFTATTPMGGISLSGAWDPQDPRIGLAACEAKKYLISLPRAFAWSSKIDAKTYEEKNIIHLNPAFAQCVAQFVKGFKQSHNNAPVTITSAFRSPCEEIKVCEGESGPCSVTNSNRSQWQHACDQFQKGQYNPDVSRPAHGNGLAVDIWPLTPDEVKQFSTNYTDPDVKRRIIAFQTAATQYGVHFSMPIIRDGREETDPRRIDRPHLVPMQGKCGYGQTSFVPRPSPGQTGTSSPSPSGVGGAQSTGAVPASGLDSGGLGQGMGAGKQSPLGGLEKMMGSFLPKQGGGSSGGGSGSGSPQQTPATNPYQNMIPPALAQSLFGTTTPTKSQLDQLIEKLKKKREAIKKCKGLKTSQARLDCVTAQLQ